MNQLNKEYITKGGLEIWRAKKIVDADFKEKLIERLSEEKGAYLCSSFEYPGRYTRWDMGFVNPPVEIRTFGRKFEIRSLNSRGNLILQFIGELLQNKDFLDSITINNDFICGNIKESHEFFSEEQRSRQPSVFSLIRCINEGFYTELDEFIGLYGSFGYDLIFQFEKIQLSRERKETQADMVLYIPDEMFFIDHKKDESFIVKYEFSYKNKTTKGIETTIQKKNVLSKKDESIPKYVKGKYAKLVDVAKESFVRGDLFEVVPSHVFYRETKESPANLFRKLKKINPSPYGFLINLGDEVLIGASPEMYVRVEGSRVETCPISGTIKRGKDAIEDAKNIKILLNSTKDESELTMCTDVDRNDKSRICVPGSVKVIGRRQIEMYSHLIHTVDHVEGILDEGYDGLDAFMTHMWAVTVTGAPKKWAIEWIEQHEESNRLWYGGAVGVLKFNGDVNTGLTLRTIRLQDSVAMIRVGATLLYDSIPEDEEEETIVKAAALNKVLDADTAAIEIVQNQKTKSEEVKKPVKQPKILLVDHEDSFVNTLASYFRMAGAHVKTLRHNIAREDLLEKDYDLVVLSPGPGRPKDFCLGDTIKICQEKNIAIFGVCLGLQGIIEYFGGKLGILETPFHGKPSLIKIIENSKIFEGVDSESVIGRYHSLYGEIVPDELIVTARSEDGIVMAIEHKDKMIYAVQFHPESIMTLNGNIGYKIIQNVVDMLGG